MIRKSALDATDRPRFAVDFYGNRHYATNIRYPVRRVSNKRPDDRKTRKRNIDPKLKTVDDEFDAFVMEITDPSDEVTPTEPMQTTDATTETVASTMETATATTISPVIGTDSTESPIESSTAAHAHTTPAQLANVMATMPTLIGADVGFKPMLDFYYGGTPNEHANSIYLTTSKPLEIADTSTPHTNTAPLHRPTSSNRFRPSVQYEYQNYRYRVDDHFIPIVGLKQIF